MTCSRSFPGAVILGGGFGSLAAARNLAHHGVEVCILGSAISVARFSRSVRRFSVRPRDLEDDALPGYLAAMAEKGGMKGWVLIPSDDEDVRVLSQHARSLTSQYILTTPPWETVRFLYDKRQTYALAQQVGIAIPHLYAVGNTARLDGLELDFPVVVKPAFSGQLLRVTHRKAYRADNRSELKAICATMARIVGDSRIIVQDFLPDPGANLFSFAGYFRKGNPLVGLSAKRTRQFPRDFGRSSTFVEAVEVPELRSLATRLLRAIDYTGLAEVEFMWNAKLARYELLEVNPRIWAWHGLAIAAGLDLPYMAFADAIGQDPPVRAMRPGFRWVRLLNDVGAAVPEIGSGRLGVMQYARSLVGSTTFSVLSVSDPLPAIVEPFLILLAHMRKRSRRKSSVSA